MFLLDNLFDELYELRGKFFQACLNSDLQELKNVIKSLQARSKESERSLNIQHQSDKKTPLMIACENGYADVVGILLNAGANPDAKSAGASGYTPLHRAIQKNNIEIIRLLLNRNANLNVTDDSGQTPLMLACELNNTNLVSFFLQQKANPNAADVWGRTALMIACEKGYLDIASHLLNSGAKPDAADRRKRTAVIMACEKGHTDIVKLFLARNALEKNQSGYIKLTTVELTKLLWLACTKDLFALVPQLLKHGADPNAKDKRERTPLFYACQNDKEWLVAALLGQQLAEEPKEDTEGCKLELASGTGN